MTDEKRQAIIDAIGSRLDFVIGEILTFHLQGTIEDFFRTIYRNLFIPYEKTEFLLMPDHSLAISVYDREGEVFNMTLR